MIALRQVTKGFGAGPVLHRVDLEVPPGAVVILSGPSGCGKTTLLRLVAGLVLPDEGEILLDGQVASRPGAAREPHLRGMGFLFQEPALWPHMTVAGQLSFALRGRERDWIPGILQALGLPGLEDRHPHELSLGQARRVALARSLAPSPARLLLDEPLASLDEEARRRVLQVVRAHLEASGASVLVATHDPAPFLDLGSPSVFSMAGS